MRNIQDVIAGEVDRFGVAETANAFIGRVGPNTQTSFVNEPALDFVDQFDVLVECNVVVVLNAVAVLINVADAVLPDLLLSCCCRTRVSEQAVIAVDRAHLARLLLEGHPREQIVDSLLGHELLILLTVFCPVFIQINPPSVIDWLHRNSRCRDEATGGN